MQGSAFQAPGDAIDNMMHNNSAARHSSLVAAASQQQAVVGSCEALQVEVDVVACDGLAWIEVKNQELFGVDSVHYAGSNSYKGLKQQVSRLGKQYGQSDSVHSLAQPKYTCTSTNQLFACSMFPTLD